jgi:hypothetical protein
MILYLSDYAADSLEKVSRQAARKTQRSLFYALVPSLRFCGSFLREIMCLRTLDRFEHKASHAAKQEFAPGPHHRWCIGAMLLNAPRRGIRGSQPLTLCRKD